MRHIIYETVQKARLVNLIISWTMIAVLAVMICIKAFDGMWALILMNLASISLLAICEVIIFNMDKKVIKVEEIEEL